MQELINVKDCEIDDLSKIVNCGTDCSTDNRLWIVFKEENGDTNNICYTRSTYFAHVIRAILQKEMKKHGEREGVSILLKCWEM